MLGPCKVGWNLSRKFDDNNIIIIIIKIKDVVNHQDCASLGSTLRSADLRPGMVRAAPPEQVQEQEGRAAAFAIEGRCSYSIASCTVCCCLPFMPAG